jgi:hypothetical protein
MTTFKKYTVEWWCSLPPERVGKETELIVEGIFTEMNKKQSFAWHRLPDAKSSRGFVKAQPSDYMYRKHHLAGFVEVKALKHEYRLPAPRLTQLPTLLKWSMAGSFDYVLIHHYTTGLWRIMEAQELDTGVPSWDLRKFDTFSSAKQALLSTGVF